jgi:hypothetical protein
MNIFSVHIQIAEQVSISLARDGSLKSLDLKGDLQVEIQDRSTGPIRIKLAEPSSASPGDLQYKQNPKVVKFDPTGERAIASESFPVGRALELLRWRLMKKDESYLPLSSTCLYQNCL